jgi:hypothetical protein
MIDAIKQILAPQLRFEGANDIDKFTRFFCELYRITIFKDGLDLILTKIKEKHLRFEIKIMNGWDTNLGCYLTEQNKFFNKIAGGFSSNLKQKIILRKMSYNVIAHEMAHALEFESGVNLGEEFRKCIGFDMKNREASLITLRAEIKRLMVEALKSYKPEQFLSELFARYVELLSVSRDVCGSGDFTTSEVMEFFVNTTNFIIKIFNVGIKNKIDPELAMLTNSIIAKVNIAPPEKKFQDKIDSNSGKKFSKNIKSNAMWQKGWKQYQELEDKK